MGSLGKSCDMGSGSESLTPECDMEEGSWHQMQNGCVVTSWDINRRSINTLQHADEFVHAWTQELMNHPDYEFREAWQ